jgi:hypothetical protein
MIDVAANVAARDSRHLQIRWNGDVASHPTVDWQRLRHHVPKVPNFGNRPTDAVKRKATRRRLFKSSMQVDFSISQEVHPGEAQKLHCSSRSSDAAETANPASRR